MADGILYGNFFFLGRLNAGGMAEVFLGKGYDRKYANKLLAIKRMRRGLSEDTDFVSMFKDEATIASQLSHSNICRLFEQGQHAGQLFLVMEFIHGKDVRALRQRSKQRGELIPARIAGLIISRMATALDYAHGLRSPSGELQGIVHRDISPQNILLSYDGIPKLIDFGIAKAKGRLAKTQVGVLKGKFAYMAPEQATGQAVDGRTDLFALGVVLYEMLTDEAPFKGSSDFSTLQRITNCEYRPPLELNPEIPRRLAAVVQRAMLRDPNDRYQTGQEMAADIDGFLAEDARPANEATLSAFMRKLFREDYIREMARIREYLSVQMPPLPAGGEGPDLSSFTEPTAVSVVPLDDLPTPIAATDEEVPTTPLSPLEAVDTPAGAPSYPGDALDAALAEADSILSPTDTQPQRAPTGFEQVPTRQVSHEEIAEALRLGAARENAPADESDPSAFRIEADQPGRVTTTEEVVSEALLADALAPAEDEAALAKATEESPLPAFGTADQQAFAPMIADAARAQQLSRRRGLTPTEMLILALAALLGAGVVAATYWILASSK